MLYFSSTTVWSKEYGFLFVCLLVFCFCCFAIETDMLNIYFEPTDLDRFSGTPELAGSLIPFPYHGVSFIHESTHFTVAVLYCGWVWFKINISYPYKSGPFNHSPSVSVILCDDLEFSKEKSWVRSGSKWLHNLRNWVQRRFLISDFYCLWGDIPTCNMQT